MPTVQRSRRSWGEPPWQTLPLQGVADSFPARPDVAIVGGGLTGVATAYYLARRGIRAVLFEAARVGSGASGRTGGLTLEGLASGPRDGARDCLAGLRRIVEEADLNCGLDLRGCWEIEHRDRGVQSLPWRDGDAPIGIARTVPGGVVEPGKLVTGITRAAISLGASICEGCPVDAIVTGPSPQLKVKHELVSPGQIVVAVNAWTNALVARTEKVHSALTYACAIGPLGESALTEIGLADRIPFYTADTPYLWGRVCADRSVVFGAGLTYGEPQQLERLAIDEAEPAAILDRLETRIRALHPALAGGRIAARWAGPIAFRPGAIPILTRHPEAPKILVAGAYAGHGVAFSVHAGRLMADEIADGTPLPEWGRIE